MKTPILGSSYVLRSPNAADSRCINLYPEIVPEGGKEPAWLQRAPGLRLLTELPTGPVRGLWTFNDIGFAVAGDTFYRINEVFEFEAKGTVTGTGPVSMVDNGTQLFIACNGPSYIYNVRTDQFAQITDPDFPGAVMVGYIDGYFTFNEPNSQRFWVTSLLDGTSIDPLDFASAEGSPDDLVSLMVDHREVWLFGQNSVEVWYDAGGEDFPLARIQGAFNEIGCIAPYSVAKLDNGLFWLGADARGRGVVYRAEGYTGKRVSTHAVEWQIQQYRQLQDAQAYTYQQDGHAFYVLNFPTADTTWVYDVATGAWHERAAWVNDRFTRHRGNCQMSFANNIVIGDYSTGALYAFDLNVYSDNGQPQKWLRSWRALNTGQNTLKRTIHHSLQLDCESGVGLNGYDMLDYQWLMTEPWESDFIRDRAGSIIMTRDGESVEGRFPVPGTPEYILTEDGQRIPVYLTNQPGANSQVMLRWSDNGGHTWSSEHWKSMGKIGEYGHRVIWRRLGATLGIRDRVYEVSGTDPVKIAIMGAELQLSETNA
jgi:hypothetical protein